ncbi:MAG TPA: histidine kinase [Bryobacteraceae bacterium]|nr:histidine kinase [Bryobacteraceae bacterium]
MHPLLESSRRLALYLAAWIPVLALLVYVMWASGGIGWLDATVVLAPSCLIYAFACLSPWYICGTLPLGADRWQSLAITFGMASTMGSLVLVGGAWLTASAVAETGKMAGIEQRLHGHLALLFGMGVLLYLLSAGLHYAALAVEASHEAERQAAEARTLAREAELQSLRNQLNPHFLFNSLHSISALATQDGARAREMCVRLADFLRSSLGLGSQENIPLREELALARSYLEVEQVRFGERLRVVEDVAAACQECSVPPLLLQPLVENAIKHGVAGMLEGGAIRLTVEQTDGAVSITVENGFDPDMAMPRKLGIGLSHVRRRLEVRYGEQASFDAGVFGNVYRVVLRFPCESPMASSSLA